VWIDLLYSYQLACTGAGETVSKNVSATYLPRIGEVLSSQPLSFNSSWLHQPLKSTEHGSTVTETCNMATRRKEADHPSMDPLVTTSTAGASAAHA
jgi:hypothetical protein